MRVVCANCGKRQDVKRISVDSALFSVRKRLKKHARCKNCGIIIGEYDVSGKIQLWYGAGEKQLHLTNKK